MARNVQMIFKVEADERDKLKAAAVRGRLTFAAWARSVLLAKAAEDATDTESPVPGLHEGVADD